MSDRGQIKEVKVALVLLVMYLYYAQNFKEVAFSNPG
jgi:hypothetical protein